MAKRPPPEILQSYIVPLVLAIAVLAVSQLINFVSVSHLLESAALFAVLVGGLFIGQYVAFKALRVQERDALYSVLSAVSFSGRRAWASSNVLTQQDVLALEASAHEVWVYAFDLNYEKLDRDWSPFTNAVASNLTAGVMYRYLIPDAPDLILRAERMYHYLCQFTQHDDQLEFRVSTKAPLFTQFGMTLYNPDTLDRTSLRTNSPTEPIAIYFPHASDFTSDQPTPFIAVRNGKALAIQEQFDAHLRGSREMRRPKKKAT